MMRALQHQENLKICYQERALDLQLLYTNWKDTSHNSGVIIYVYRLEEHELRFNLYQRRLTG